MGAIDKNQTPAPKVSSGKDTHELDTTMLENALKNTKKGAANNPDATKTPEKIKKGNLNESKREDNN